MLKFIIIGMLAGFSFYAGTLMYKDKLEQLRESIKALRTRNRMLHKENEFYKKENKNLRERGR